MRKIPKLIYLLLMLLFFSCYQEGLIYDVELKSGPIPIIEAIIDVKEKEIYALGAHDVQYLNLISNMYLNSSFDHDFTINIIDSKNSIKILENLSDTSHLKNNFSNPVFNYYADLEDISFETGSTLSLDWNHHYFGSGIFHETIPEFPETIFINEISREIIDWEISSGIWYTDSSYVIEFNQNFFPEKFYALIFFRTNVNIDGSKGGAIQDIKTNNPFFNKRTFYREGNYLYFLFTEQELTKIDEGNKFYIRSNHIRSPNEFYLPNEFHVRFLSENLYKYLISISKNPILIEEQAAFYEPSDIYSLMPEGIGMFGLYKDFIFEIK